MSTYKLYFRYGTMNSSKTANLLMLAHNYRQQGKKVVIIKPRIDSRFGTKNIVSRCGLKNKADIILNKHDITALQNYNWDNTDCILVEESNFLSPNQINELRLLTLRSPVICYGLRTDYRSKLFPGSKRLMEIADSIKEIKNTCTYCSQKSIINMKHIEGNAIRDGSNSPDLGCEEKYLPTCWKCWHERPNYVHIDQELPTSRDMDFIFKGDDSLPYPRVTKEFLDKDIESYFK